MSRNKKRENLILTSAVVSAIAVVTAVITPVYALDLSIYGVGHLSGDRIDNGTTSSSYIHSNSSRLGFKGSHDLRSGFSVLFQYESGVDLTGNGTGDGNGGASSGGQIFTRTRDSFVGLKGGFGTLLVGRVGGLNQWVYDYNLFGDQVGDLGNIWGGDGLPGRLDSAASYRSPTFGGFSIGLTYSPNQGNDERSNAVVKADYATGKLKVGAAYANFGNGSGSSDTKVSAITASYDFGAFNLGGGWQRETNIGGSSSDADRNKYTVGAAMKVGSSGTIKAQYASAGDLGGTSDTKASQWAVGYDHAWDKNTTIYVAYARTSNGTGASYSAYNYGHGDQGVPGIALGGDPSVISIGVVYKFDVGLIKP